MELRSEATVILQRGYTTIMYVAFFLILTLPFLAVIDTHSWHYKPFASIHIDTISMAVFIVYC